MAKNKNNAKKLNKNETKRIKNQTEAEPLTDEKENGSCKNEKNRLEN